MIKYNIFTCLLTILGRDDVWRVSIRKKWYSLLLFFFISNYNYDKNEYCGGFFLINDLVLQYTCSKTCNVRSNLERAWTYN